MLEDLPGLWSVTPIGGMLGMLIILYWLLASGRLITRSSHERELSMERHRGDEWKETAVEARSLTVEQSDQISVLLESLKTSSQFFGTVGGQHGPQKE